jgi:hypothetical protein
MNHDGVTRWTGVPKSSVSFTPGRGRGGSKRLLSMKFTGGTGGGGGIGFDYAELAGTSSRPGARFSKVYDRGGYSGLQHRVNGAGQSVQQGYQGCETYQGSWWVFCLRCRCEALQGH